MRTTHAYSILKIVKNHKHQEFSFTLILHLLSAQSLFAICHFRQISFKKIFQKKPILFCHFWFHSNAYILQVQPSTICEFYECNIRVKLKMCRQYYFKSKALPTVVTYWACWVCSLQAQFPSVCLSEWTLWEPRRSHFHNQL